MLISSLHYATVFMNNSHIRIIKNYHDERLHSIGSSYMSKHSATLCTHSVIQLCMHIIVIMNICITYYFVATV